MHDKMYECSKDLKKLIEKKDRLNCEINDITDRRLDLLKDLEMLDKELHHISYNINKIAKKRDDLLVKEMKLREEEE